MDPTTVETPEDSLAPVAPAGRKTLKVHLTPEQAAQVKSDAHKHELSQSEYARFRLLGETLYKLPDATKLEAVARQLAGIGANINQGQKAINEAKAAGVLNDEQFNAMYKIYAEARRIWLEPLDELKAEFAKLRPTER